LGEVNSRTKDEIVQNSLQNAVIHAEQGEWVERPRYQNGLAAFDVWASLFEKGALIIEAGKGNNIKQDTWNFAAYYASHYYSARCYARDYLKKIANGNDQLTKAAVCYETVASLLRLVWYNKVINKNLHADTLRVLAQNIKKAQQSEKAGIQEIITYLKRSS